LDFEDRQLRLGLTANGSSRESLGVQIWAPSSQASNYSTDTANGGLFYNRFKTARDRDDSDAVSLNVYYYDYQRHGSSQDALPSQLYQYLNDDSSQTIQSSGTISLSRVRYWQPMQMGFETAWPWTYEYSSGEYGFSAQDIPGGPSGYSTSGHFNLVNVSGSARFFFGVGRVLDSHWAWTALQLLASLEAEGRLKRRASPEEAQALTDELARQGLGYAWDSRQTQLARARQVLRLLADAGLIEAQDDGLAALLVVDERAYLQSARLNGAQARLGAKLRGQYLGSDIWAAYASIFNGPTVDVELSAEWWRSVGLDWQLGLVAAGHSTPRETAQTFSMTNDYQNMVDGDLTASLGWMPSTRLSLQGSASLGGQRVDRLYSPRDNRVYGWQTETRSRSGLHATLNYSLAPALVLSAGWDRTWFRTDVSRSYTPLTDPTQQALEGSLLGWPDDDTTYNSYRLSLSYRFL
jgi:hypothetical protein